MAARPWLCHYLLRNEQDFIQNNAAGTQVKISALDCMRTSKDQRQIEFVYQTVTSALRRDFTEGYIQNASAVGSTAAIRPVCTQLPQEEQDCLGHGNPGEHWPTAGIRRDLVFSINPSQSFSATLRAPNCSVTSELRGFLLDASTLAVHRTYVLATCPWGAAFTRCHENVG